jgi:hypothetical protein
MIPAAASKSQLSEWITGAEARRICRLSNTVLYHRAMIGQIRFRLDPGIPVRYHREDVERLSRAGDRAAPGLQLTEA